MPAGRYGMDTIAGLIDVNSVGSQKFVTLKHD